MKGHEALALLHPVVRRWFETTLGQPTPPQAMGWPAIARGDHTLILAPTGSGKTLAAFLVCLDRLYADGLAGPLPDAVRVLYVSPLKALNNDIRRNLDVPLEGIAAAAAAQGLAWPEIRSAVRTGDTGPSERSAMLRRPPHLLITTPESLYLLLTSPRARSATQRPLDEVARYLGGLDAAGAFRPATIVDAGMRKQLDLLVTTPAEDFRALREASVWPEVWPKLLELVSAHRSTLIFVNNRRLAERVAARLNEMAGHELVRTHHGSMSREAREQVEALLKEGRLPALACTSSLELGIDVGSVDCVVQLESPKAVARGLQRVGRAGHLVGKASKGRLIPQYRADLLEATVIARGMLRGEVEATRVPQNALDVLSQQITAMAAVEPWAVSDLHGLVRRAYPYHRLSRGQLDAVLEMLSGRYPAEQFRELRPRLQWDRVHDRIAGLPSARVVATGSGGTIPDRGYYHAVLQGSEVRLGELDEEFVYESRVGDVFLLGSSTWRIWAIEADRVVVSDAHGAPPQMPFWKGDGLGRPFELGEKLGAFVREVEARLDEPPAELLGWLRRECALDPAAARNLRNFVLEQRDAGALPTDRRVVVEAYRDEVGDWRVAVLSPFGARVHAAWAMALGAALRRRLGFDPERLHSDNGIMFRISAAAAGDGRPGAPGATGDRNCAADLPDAAPPLDFVGDVTPDNLESLLLGELEGSPLFATYFRYAAQRALLLPRRRPGKRLPLWLQRLRAGDLLQVARRHESFPVVLETFRECLQDVLDLDDLRRVVEAVDRGDIAVEARVVAVPSPWVAALQFAFIAVFMYQGDMPKAERRAQLLSVNRDLLRDVLGEGQIRELLDPTAIAEVAARLGRTAPGWQARTPEEVAGLLQEFGDLTDSELAARVAGGAAEARRCVEALAAEGRAVRIRWPGAESRWIAAEDAPLYLAAHAPATAVEPLLAELAAAAAALPPALREQAWDPDEARRLILTRFARGRAPFTLADVTNRYAWPAPVLLQGLAELRETGTLVEGALTRGRSLTEWCDAEALRLAHRQSLNLLRRQVEPREARDFARHLVRWHHCQPSPSQARSLGAGSGPAALLRAVERLQGLYLPADAWERDIFPRRLPGYQPEWLDQLCATGQVVWTGAAGPGGGAAGRGRVGFFLREDFPLLAPSHRRVSDQQPGPDDSPDATAVRDALRRRGAMFLADLSAFTGLHAQAALAALWQLVWAGEVTNDTFAPVRHVDLISGRGRSPVHAPRRGSPPSRGDVARAAVRRAERDVRARLQTAALAGAGRWSLLSAPPELEPGRRAERFARLWLSRYGLVNRDVARLEDDPVPWGWRSPR